MQENHLDRLADLVGTAARGDEPADHA